MPTISATQLASYDNALVASTAMTFTFTPSTYGLSGNSGGGSEFADCIEVHTDGTAEIYYSVDGSTPTVKGANTLRIPNTAGIYFLAYVSTLRVISAGTPTIHVMRNVAVATA